MHLHINFLTGLLIFLFYLAFVGTMKITALRYEGHPLADAVLEVF